MWKEIMQRVREQAPLIHCITNYVTANDCANALLACGASPIMADDPEEAEEITAICKGLTLNLGTLNSRTIPSMLAAGKRANDLGHPVVLDPVGVGASALRNKTAERLLNEVRIAVIRGNLSEIRALTSGQESIRGVDANVSDKITEDSLEAMVAFVKQSAMELGVIVAATGVIDIVTDGKIAYCIRNGHSGMQLVTGAGCQLSSLTAAYVATNPEKPLEAAAAAVGLMGLCGEKAYRRTETLFGNASYRNAIIDEICRVTPEELERGIKYEVR